MINPWNKFFVLIAIILIPFCQICFSSCHGNDEKGKDGIAKMIRADSLLLEKQKADSVKASEQMKEEQKVEHISKTDSIRISDSIKRTKNPIRDFN